MTGKVWQLWGVAFPAAVTFASFALWFFGGVGNSFISAFRLSPAAVLPSSPPWPPEDAALRCLPPGYALAPVVKVTGSRQTYRGMENNMDFAAGAVTMPERPTEATVIWRRRSWQSAGTRAPWRRPTASPISPRIMSAGLSGQFTQLSVLLPCPPAWPVVQISDMFFENPYILYYRTIFSIYWNK